MVAFYEAERARFNDANAAADGPKRDAALDGFLDADPTKISWSRALRNDILRNKALAFDGAGAVRGLYRPFAKDWLYYDRRVSEEIFRMPGVFPRDGSPNRAIGVSASESRSGYSVLMTCVVPSLHAADMVGSQFFPLYLYEANISTTDDASEPHEPSHVALFASDGPLHRYSAKPSTDPIRRDGITDAGLAHFQSFYPTETITKEDLFYYVYGILHSPDYRARYADNLGKELPRIPRVKSAADFRAFVDAGRRLGDLHVGYEAVPEHLARIEGPSKPTPEQLRVEKMRFGKGKDKTVIHYNAFFTVRDIPLEAYAYVVNGKPAIEWVMERQAVTTDKDSGIVKDANAWAIETVGDPRYPLSLLLRVITVSLETMKIVGALPALVLEGE
jgi:predicted helicase